MKKYLYLSLLANVVVLCQFVLALKVKFDTHSVLQKAEVSVRLAKGTGMELAPLLDAYMTAQSFSILQDGVVRMASIGIVMATCALIAQLAALYLLVKGNSKGPVQVV